MVIFNYFKRAEVKRISTDLTSQGFMIDLIASQHSLDSGLVFVTSDYHIIDYSVQESKSPSTLTKINKIYPFSSFLPNKPTNAPNPPLHLQIIQKS